MGLLAVRPSHLEQEYGPFYFVQGEESYSKVLWCNLFLTRASKRKKEEASGASTIQWDRFSLQNHSIPDWEKSSPPQASSNQTEAISWDDSYKGPVQVPCWRSLQVGRMCVLTFLCSGLNTSVDERLYRLSAHRTGQLYSSQ